MNAPNVTIHAEAEARAVADVVKNGFAPRTVELLDETGKTRQVLIVPHGMQLKSAKELVDEYRIAPERREGQAELTSLDSFIAHVVRFADAHSAIFADKSPGAPSLLAVLDYHEKGFGGAPRFGKHRTRYAFPLSEEWLAWTQRNNQVMTQVDFGRWVEDRLGDVLAPEMAGEASKLFQQQFSCALATAHRLLEMSKGLHIHSGEQVKQYVNLDTGETRLTFESKHTGENGQPLNLPGAFLLGIPVFRGGALYQIPARLRYRLKDGVVTFHYTLHRQGVIFDHAVDEACGRAEKETKLPLYAGAPEHS
jgi:hypothetical protein